MQWEFRHQRLVNTVSEWERTFVGIHTLKMVVGVELILSDLRTVGQWIGI